MRFQLALFAAVQLLAIGLVNVSRAGQEPAAGENQSLVQAEQAYQRVNFAETYDAACNGLSRGSTDTAQTTRLHVLCGISAAALEKTDEARAHFKVALALDPDLKLERQLSPKIRGPYLEAQGDWAGVSVRLSLSLVKRNDAHRLHFKVVDPAHLASKLKLYVRAPAEAQFRPIATEVAANLSLLLPSDLTGRSYVYYAVLVDQQGNALRDLGSESDPFEVAAQPGPDTQGGLARSPAEPSFSEKPSGQSHWLEWALMGTGLASAGAGVYFNVLREDAAHKWNGPGCEQPGMTRIAQCATVNSDRARDERAAIGFYTAGGLLVAAGVTLWAISEPKPDRATQGQVKPTRAMTCAAALPWAAVTCSGRF